MGEGREEMGSRNLRIIVHIKCIILHRRGHSTGYICRKRIHIVHVHIRQLTGECC